MNDKDQSILTVNDEIDLTSLLSVFLENLNFLISIFLVSLPVLGIYYLTSEEIYRTDSLIEVQNESKSFLPTSLNDPLGSKNNSLNDILDFSKISMVFLPTFPDAPIIAKFILKTTLFQFCYNCITHI